MKPRIKLAESRTEDGKILALYSHDGAFSINVSGNELMQSKSFTSERLLGELGVAHLKSDNPARVLVGGLGLGFTLQSVLESVGPEVKVEVVELLPEVIEWNREYLKELNGALLDDPRVEVIIGDVASLIRRAKYGTYDAVMLDVDNGPVALVAKANVSLYSNSGIRSIRTALKVGGRAVFWSASPDQRFVARLERNGFQVEAVPAKIHERAKRAAYILYVVEKSEK
ncbi:spermine synthase [Rubellicoccus peritrichatus]|uniref:Spermine synthase n=1 Tax=Rubellicoccus peritrichatus TaxID=3080537 RepID=A0AAQ3L6N4_9BACT|nr:spermine synthase [Puniceicoccus sp. CR14]WOO40310.1 spermine synthase [Puniceicoccus sp. CR14]